MSQFDNVSVVKQANVYFDGNVDHQSGDSVSPLPAGPEIVAGRMILQSAGRLAAFVPQAAWTGPRVGVLHTAAQPIAMALHELALNARQHGALSAPEGRVALRWRIEPGADRALERVGMDGAWHGLY